MPVQRFYQRIAHFLILLLFGIALVWFASPYLHPMAQSTLPLWAGVNPRVTSQPFYEVPLPTALPAYLPADSGFVNVKSWGAKGDGITDDTAILQAIVGRHKDDPDGAIRNIYIPNGTYLVSEPLIWGDKKKNVWGESRDGVVIKLTDHAPGFQNPRRPKKVLEIEYGHGGQNFDQHLRNLTVDIGVGNRGAIAVGFHTNNSGGITNVVIRSSDPEKQGSIGLALDKEWPGPGLIKNVAIDGFDTGIYINHDQYSMTFEHITLTNQRRVGLLNSWNSIAIHDLKSMNHVTAIENRGEMALMALVDVELQGGDGAVPAVINHANGVLFARNVQTQGYGLAIDNQAGQRQTLASNTVDEFVSHPVSSLGSAAGHSLNLLIEDPPEIPIGTPDSWVSVTQFGAIANDNANDGPAIQAAIDSGAKSVYFPVGDYNSDQTIQVRGQVQRIVGLGAHLLFKTPNQPAFLVRDGTGDPLMLDIETNYGNDCSYWIEQASPRTLIFRNGSYINSVPGGKVFVEDSSAEPLILDRQQVWMRQINTESYDHNPHIVNRGGDLWILGLKTEKDRTIIGTYEGGKTEVIGGLLYKNQERVGPAPAFIVKDSFVSLTYRNKGLDYQTQVEEVRQGETWLFTIKSVSASHGRTALYTSAQP